MKFEDSMNVNVSFLTTFLLTLLKIDQINHLTSSEIIDVSKLLTLFAFITALSSRLIILTLSFFL